MIGELSKISTSYKVLYEYDSKNEMATASITVLSKCGGYFMLIGSRI